MKFDELLIFLVIGLILLGFLYEQKEKRERKRREAEFAVKHAEVAKERDIEIQKSIPIHMVNALSQFESDVRSGSADFEGMHDFSPLTCFGYRVGKTNGVSESIRREIIYYTWYATLPPIIPSRYAAEWAGPGTYKRYSKIVSHLTMLASQRRNRTNYEVAVNQWEGDVRWFKDNYSIIASRYNLYGFRE